MEQLPVEKFYGVGKVTAAKMKSMGLFSGADLKQLSATDLTRHFGKAGRFYYQIVRGIDDRPVQAHRATKSQGAEDTFAYDLTTLEEMEEKLDKIALIVHERLYKKNLQGRTLTLKIKYNDFKQITRSRSTTDPIVTLNAIQTIAKELLALTFEDGQRVRLLGISLSNFGEIKEQLRLF